MHILAATLFVSAFLLFVCQPMVGKMLLPHLGGAASVWTTCVLFFQFMLLMGYVYAHLLARVGSIKKQVLTHTAVLVVPLAFLPIRMDEVSAQPLHLNPVLGLLGVLAATTAAPFFVVSATAPLLQNWLSRTRHAAAADPYFLYSASNAGSLLALIAYPFWIEPRIGVAAQSRLWLWGYAGLIAAFALSLAVLSRHGWATREEAWTEGPIDVHWKSRLFWVAGSFLPSALMLAVTNHVSANVGPVPFLWLVPLALYLLTFIFAFGNRFRATSGRVSRLIPVILLGMLPLVAAGIIAPPGLNWIIIAVHLILLFSGALLCHTRLAESRPESRRLTEFYFWVALGGVLGGCFTAILAPAVFDTVFEYPLLVAALPFLRVGRLKKFDLVIATGTGVALAAAWILFRFTQLDSNVEAVALAHTALLFVGYKMSRNTQRFACYFAVVMLAYAMILPSYIEGADSIHTSRNFFGVKKVLTDPDEQLRKLLHGDTIHGIESTDPTQAGQPLSYYYPGGSVSDVINVMRQREGAQRIAVLGLGAGTMASYADATRHVTFYEIDPAIEPIARQYFTFLTRCGSKCTVITGDGRLQLEREPDETFDLLLLDAFSSDSIPAHLVSREALEIYLKKLKRNGILLFHVSNRYLNIDKLVAALVAEAGLVAFSRFDDAGELRGAGKASANHLVAARRLEDLEPVPALSGWNRVSHPAGFEPWTDDYSNLLSLIRWH